MTRPCFPTDNAKGRDRVRKSINLLPFNEHWNIALALEKAPASWVGMSDALSSNECNDDLKCVSERTDMVGIVVIFIAPRDVMLSIPN